MQYLSRHPFVVGFVAALGLFGIGRVLPSEMLSGGQRHALGLMAFGGLFVALGRAGLDREDAFWVFLGGVCGLLLSVPIALGGR